MKRDLDPVLLEVRDLLRELLGELRRPRTTPRQAAAARRRELLRQVAAATSSAPTTWACAAEVALMIEGEAAPPEACAAAVRTLRADPEVPRSVRRIYGHLAADPADDGSAVIDDILRQWNAGR